MVSSLHLNSLLGLVGLELVPALSAATTRHKSERRATEDAAGDLPEARVEDLHADLSEYCSEEDPDFVQPSSSSSSDSEDSAEDVKKSSSSSSGSSSSESEDGIAEAAETAEEVDED